LKRGGERGKKKCGGEKRERERERDREREREREGERERKQQRNAIFSRLLFGSHKHF